MSWSPDGTWGDAGSDTDWTLYRQLDEGNAECGRRVRSVLRHGPSECRELVPGGFDRPAGLHFAKAEGREPVGKGIVDQSLLILLSVTQGSFGKYMKMLMGSVWQDDEIQ